ncbi:hypothetical protein F935_01884 [Acinetobacter calcoaceticus ANC 3811]|uniref:Uncharacterized protein n=1 Tax=Acinetobacter calcoaceticus ANC 3811 TaxID=1217690 RepID=R8Y0S0_ACICA|nr:hypothetical protein [Acinetobacter calcoaceticus]EOQ62794.1 hypothetical protein F935_01884 [Acinetobacter calcoaceticus ANC 3811]
MSIQSKKIILVANSDSVFDINSIINDQDVIVRFNIPNKQKIEITGRRTDFLFLANTVDLMEKRLRNKKFNNFVDALKNTNIFFPYEDDLINKINPVYKLVYRRFFIKFKKDVKNSNNNKYISYFFKKNIKVNVIDQSYYWAAKNLMNKESSSILTTGFIAMYYFLHNEEYTNYDIYLHGFTFQGWSGHDWEQEKKCILNLIANQKIHIF